MLVTEEIKRFLNYYTHADLAALYNPGMEVQVMVRPDGGSPTENGKAFTNGDYTWHNLRIPKNARTTPEFRDFTLGYPLSEHALAVGMTGWNFKDRLSMHVGFDFDVIMGEAHKNSGIDPLELERVREAACSIPWVEVRKSTGGGGLHLRVYLGKGIPAANHTEHAGLGRAILSMMCAEAGYNFTENVDICGGNMWVWHRKMTAENDGLKLIKSRVCDLIDLPDNWRDHIEVVSNRRRKVRVQGLPEQAHDSFEKMADANRHTLDDSHRQMIDFITEQGWTCVWESDYNMLRTHTKGIEEAFEKMEMKGIFKTLATGRDKGDYNCFCFPRPNGAWRIVRYGQGTMESDTWVQDGKGWTYCYLNQLPDFNTAAASRGGVEDQTGGFMFDSGSDAMAVAKMLGANLEIPAELQPFPTKLKIHKDGNRIIMEMDKPDGVSYDKRGFLEKKNKISKVVAANLPKQEGETENYDDTIRHLLSPAGQQAGWVVKIHDEWYGQTKDNVISVLMSEGMSGNDAKAITGSVVKNGWRLVNMPFQPEYPGARRWNKEGAQFRFRPADDDNHDGYEHWNKVFDHCGYGLNAAIAEHEWCKEHGVFTGADYLRLWVASMFQHTSTPLPYLFFYSEPYQNCGKSTFHQALRLLMTKGVERADNAITNSNGFNGELMGAILCVIEETDLSKAGQRAYDRVKDWVTSREMNIHIKGLTPFMQTNTSHWVQCSNYQRACPMFEGDTRITMVQVPPIKNEIPWPQLEKKLCDEAPAFLRAMLDTIIPPANGRLRIPVIETEEKTQALEFTRDELQTYIANNCYHIPGQRVAFADFYEAFSATLGAAEKAKWSKYKVAMSLPPKYPRGNGTNNKTFIGNLSLSPMPDNYVAPGVYERHYNKLVLVNNGTALEEIE